MDAGAPVPHEVQAVPAGAVRSGSTQLWCQVAGGMSAKEPGPMRCARPAISSTKLPLPTSTSSVS